MIENGLEDIKGCVAIIPAAGIGKRFASDIPKQYSAIPLSTGKKERSVLEHTLDLFLKSEKIGKLVLVISADDQFYSKLSNIGNNKIIIVDGGVERVNSVHNALKYLFDHNLPETTSVMVHDAVRPCLSSTDLERLIEKHEDLREPCFLSSKISDSIKRIDNEGRVTENVERDDLVRALTPQIAKFKELSKAISTVIKNDVIVTDEIAALVNCDFSAHAIESDGANIKITHLQDLELAGEILSRAISKSSS